MPNILQQLGSAIKRGVNGMLYGAGFTKSNIFPIGSQEVYATIDQENAVERGFNNNAAVYSIVKKDAKKFGSIERYLESEDGEAVEKHPLLDLLNRPNPHQSQDAFLTLVRTFYKVCGEAFIWLNRGDAAMEVDENGDLVEISSVAYARKPVIEMYVIPSNHMVVMTDPNDPFEVAGYHLRNNPKVQFRKEDIIHWKDINLDWEEFSKPHLRGMTALRPGYKTLQADNSAVDSMVRMFQNDGAKGVLANKTIGAKMNPVQQSQLQSVMDNKINNKDVKNAVAALEGDWTYHSLGLTSVDMETIKGREFIYKELCFLFGVPYELFDSQVTYANKSEAQKGWVINEIKPDSMQLDGELNRVLGKAFKLEAGTKICSNFDDLPELQVDKEKEIKWRMSMPFVPAEIRKEMGFEDYNDGEEMEKVYIPTGYQPIEEDPELEAAQQEIAAYELEQRGNRENSNGKVPAPSKGKNMP